MKIYTKKSPCHTLLLLILPVILFLGVSSCKDDTNDNATQFLGTWHQTSQIKDGVTVIQDSTRLLMQINTNSICILCDSTKAAIKAKTIIKKSGWSYTNGSLNIATDLPASWKPTVEVNTLSMERIDFKQDGTISKTTLKFNRVAQVEIK